MDYLDFELEVTRVGGRDCEIAARSRAGEARETARFPLDDLALKSKLQGLQLALRHSGKKFRRIPSDEEQAVQSFGLDLFNFLIAGDVRARYDVSQREAVAAGKGLRLVLRIRDAQLAALPWEFLYDPRKAEYVCLSRHTPIVRYPELPQTVEPLAVQPPLRILVMAVSPDDLEPLDMDRETKRLEKVVKGLQGLVTLEWLGGRTWRDLQDAMQGGPWHVFHFIGHGGFSPPRDEGYIALADDDGHTFKLLATSLARLLDHPHLKLVLLNACEGAHGSDLDVFSSTAAILVRRGIPSVLAMQYEISDAAAIEFSHSFYRALARGMSVEAAVSEARKAVSVAVSDTVEWGTPVLYLRASDGHLFDVDLRREQIEAIYNDALKAAGEEDWDAAIEKLTVVLNGDAGHDEARAALHHAVAQRNISELYAEGQAHFQAGRLREALHCLGKVKEARGDYKDAARLVASIERVFKAERIDALKSEAEDLAARGDFAAAVEALESALAMGAAGDEVRARLSRLREEQELASLYDGGLRHYGEGRWPDALELFARIEARAGDYRDVKDLAANARRKLREEEERRLRARIDGLRREAERAAASEDWDAAAESLLAVLELDPADEAAAAGLAEAGRQKRLKTMYDRACEQYERGQWREALERLRRVSEIFGDYKDTSARIAVARRELEKVRGEERRRELLKRLFADVEEALGRKDWAKADELLGGAPEGADGGKLTAYRALVERGRRQEELERLNGERGQMEDAGLTEQPPVTQMPTARTPAAGTAEVEPASDVHAERPTTPAAEPDVALAKIKKARVPIIFLIAAVAATCLTLILLRRGAPTPPPDNKNATSPSPPPAPEVVKGPPSLTVESLGELSAGHDLWEVAFSPDGRTLAAVGDSGEVSLWGVGELKSLTPLKAGAAPSRSLAISPDAGTVTSGDDAGNIRLWQLGGGEQAFKTLRGHDAWVFGLAFSADGQTLTSVGGDRTVRRWRVGNGEELESIKLPPRQLVMALAPGQRAVALVADFKAAEGMVSVWSLDERRTLRKMAARAEVTCGAFSPDGGVLAAGNAKGEVRLWHVNDASPLFPPAAAKGTPLSVAFSPDGRVVAVGWRDGFIRLWSAGDGSLLKEWKGHEDAVKNLAFSGDGKTLASGGGSKLALWRVTVN